MTNKFLLALLMASVSIAAMTEKPINFDELDISEYTLEIPSALVRTRNSRSGLKLFCDKEGFAVKKGNTVKRVPSYDTDKLFRGRNLKQIAKYALLSNKFRISEFDNGDYAIHAHGELKGGGVGGATAGAWFGKAMVSVIGHGAIALVGGAVSIVATPAAGFAVATALESTLGAGIEAASMAAAVAGGVAGGVATGPV